MANQQIDLLQLFQAVAGALQQNQTTLNKADTYNHDHGDHMVNTFNVIVDALQKKQGAAPSAQLAYAGRQLQKQATTGSGQLYAKGFAQAASQFKGTQINLQTILPLIQLLLGGGKSSGSGDLLTSILAALGGLQSGSTTQSNQGSGLGGLLGGLLGGTQSSSSTQSNQGVDLGGLLGSLLGGQTQQQGGSADLLGSLAQVLLGGSAMASTPHRTQSGEIVTNTILQALGKMLNQ